jgi:4-amino-4-deoxy-L-arabinose transferase-like glycosyltransferase
MTTTLPAPPVVSPESTSTPAQATAAPTTPVPRRPAVARLFLGERTDPVWGRPALWALLVVTGILYLWNLAESGWANSFYAAAVQAGTQSWKALFFGSLDSSNFITVDKPPASLWIMGISARIFGFSSWSLLVPQALEGVAAVAMLYGTVRRALVTFGPRAATLGGLLAGLILAFTPAAALMFRFDNPDALLVLLMTAGAYCVVRALPKASWKWLALAGVALGFAFLTKMLQGLLVLPAFGVVYLMFASTTVVKRIVHLLIAAAALVVSAGWWVVATILWPAASRPYIGGSTNNTVLDLVFGYNGLARITGGSGSPGGGANGAAGSSFGGATGLERLFSSEMGLEISWLLPAALFALVAGLIALRGRSHADLPGIRMLRAGFVLLGGWLLVTGVVFSFMSGTVHPYYTVALAPAIGGLVALGGVVFWRNRERWIGRVGLAGLMVLAGGWSYALLNENPEWMPWLRWVVLAGSILCALAVLFGSVAGLRKLVAVAVIAGTTFGLGGTVAYSIATASVAHSGSIPSVGPSGSIAGGGFGGAGTGGPGGFGGRQDVPGQTSTDAATSGTSGGSGTTTTTATSVDALLMATTSRWAAAVDGSQSAATLELSSGTAVMAIGGWSSDPAPTLAEFQAYVAAGDISYYIVSGRGGAGGPNGGPGGGTSTASEIATWVEGTFSSETVAGSTVYLLTAS